MFRVIEHTIAAGPNSSPTGTRVLQDGIADIPTARAVAEAASKLFGRHGYNDEGDHWWGRNEGSGSRRVYHVEPSFP